MKDHYDFSKGIKNPYIKKFEKKQITINVNVEAIEYFKTLSNETGISYQNLINYYLIDCAKNRKTLSFEWK